MSSKRKGTQSADDSQSTPQKRKNTSLSCSKFKRFEINLNQPSTSKKSVKCIQLQALVSDDSTAKIEPEDLPNLIKIFELALNFNHKKPDLYQSFVPLNNYSFRIPRRRDVVYSLLSCIVSKRYDKAAKFLIHIAVEKFKKDHIFFNASFRYMENCANFTMDHLELFIRNAISLAKLNKREVGLELVMFKWRHNNFDPPRDIIQRISSYRHNLRKNHVIDILYAAYLSLYDYISWVKCRPIQEEIGIDTDQMDLESFKLKDRFIEGISEIVSQEGTWDIFIIKIREMLEYYNELERCEDVLESHLYANLDNLHSHVYLYDFLRKFNRSQEKQRKCLENIVKISPSDILALDFVSMLIKENNEKEAVSVLFDFLEYSRNKENILAWELMQKISFNCLMNSDNAVLKAIKKNWKKRRSYWPIYHFDECTVDVETEEKAKCASYKCVFLQIVANSTKDDLSFIEIVKNGLQQQHPKIYKKLKKKLQNIENHNNSLAELT